jgi:predicted Zn-dependent protease
MRPTTGKLACLAACLALGLAGGGPALGAKDEKPQKESKDVRTAKQMHVAFTRQMGVHQDIELQEYVQRVGEKLAAVSEMPELEWHFTIVDTDDVNAFATMGGYVYISRGILPYFQNEADLAAVLGHEIGHITAEHLKKQNRKGMLSGLASAATAIFTGMPALADLTSMAGQAIISGYGREAELEADRLGASYLAKSGYDPEAMIRVISTLKAQDTFERERARLEGREPRLYHGVFASHPDNDTRLKEAVGSAGRTAALATGSTANREGFLRAIEGLPVGSSARQGMVRDNRFYHSDMQFTLAFPRGWQVVNEPDKILAVAPKKEHIMEIRTQAPPADLTDPRDFAMRGLGNKRLSRAETLDVNGLKGWTALVRGDPSPYGKT